MAGSIKTDAELSTQIDAGIKVNGNREITPPIHNSIEQNIVASKLSVKDGGNVIQALTGYSTDLTPTDDKHLVPKKYVDDFNGFLKTDGSNSPTADIDWDGNDILNVSELSGQTGLPLIITNDSAIISLDNDNIVVQSDDLFLSGNDLAISGNGSGFVSLDTSDLSVDYVAKFPNKTGIETVAMLSDFSGRAAMADTGCLTFAGLVYNSATTINIGAAKGYIVDNETDPLNPTFEYIDYAGEINKTVTTVGSGIGSYVMLGTGGVISFQNTFPTSAERKANIWLGKVGHPAGSITTVINEPDFITSPLAQFRDLFQVLGPYVNDGVIAYANGANLQISITSGNIHGNGINFVVDNTNPNEDPEGPHAPLSFLPRTQTGAGGGFVSTVDVGNYDVGGVVTAIPNPVATSTIRYIYAVPTQGFIIQYGQTLYSNLSTAIEAIGRESQVIFSNLHGNSILIGVLVARKDATALNNTSQAQFFPADRLGQIIGATAGIATGSLQTAYNNSVTPEILTNSTNGALTVIRGSAADTDTVLEGKNGAGTTTFSVAGNGGTTISGIISVTTTLGAETSQIYTNGVESSLVNSQTATYISQIKVNSAGIGLSTQLAGSVAYLKTDNLTGNRIIQLPDGTTTLAGLSIAQTFTAKQRFTASTTEIASLTLLDTTYNTALDVSAANTLRVGNGFTSVVIPSTAPLAVASDTDTTTILGRARLHSSVTDRMLISHFDLSGSTNFALEQLSSGASKFNAASGQVAAISINRVDKVITSATETKIVSGSNFWLGNAATTGLSAGALAATTNASIVVYDSSGQAYRIPCII